jgi:putative transposase
MPNVVDAFTHERRLAIRRVARKPEATDVIDVVSDPFVRRGAARRGAAWRAGPRPLLRQRPRVRGRGRAQAGITAVGARTACIAPGSPLRGHRRGPDPCGAGATAPPSRGGRGFIEGFNARLRDELLDGEIFYSLREAQVAIESWGGGTTTMSVRTPRSAAGRRRPPR